MVDYAFYTDQYMGNAIQEPDFPRMALRAEAVLSRYERAYTVAYPEVDGEDANYNRNMVICAFAEEVQATMQAVSVGDSSTLESASVGSVSFSMGGLSAEAMVGSQPARLYSALQNYADVYRGVERPCR